MHRAFSGLLLLLVGLGACGGAPPRVAKAPVAQKQAAASPPKSATPESRLLAALHSVKPRGPVLGALDTRAHADLDALVKQVTPEQRSQIMRAGSPFASARPLLFLALGGDSPDAYLALATTSRGADELVGMRRRSGSSDLGDLVKVSAELSRRAAAEWLRDRSVDVASRRTLTKGLCDAIDAAAATLDRLDVRRRAREMAEKLDPSARRALAVARVAAWQLDGAAGHAALSRARTRGAAKEQLETAGHLLDEAALVNQQTGKLDVQATVKVSRALLDLHHPERVDALVAPHRGEAGSQLGLASVVALATLGNGMCLGAYGGAGNALLCATAWHDSPGTAKTLQLLDSAWKSGKGRDDAAIQTWLGMDYVLPWVYETLRDSVAGAADAKAHLESRLSAAQQAAKEAAAASHTFDGLALFVDASAAGLTAAKRHEAGKRVHLVQSVRKDLERRATELAKRSPGERFTQAAVLQVAGILSQEQDIGSLLSVLPDPVEPAYRHVRAVLEAWNAAVHGAQAADKARGLLAASLLRTSPHSLVRAKTVLLMAELDAALTHSPRAESVLAQVAAQLDSDATPPALRLQAGIDRAGALSRGGKTADAEKVLEKLLASGIPKGSGDAHDLALVAKTYLVVLRARGAKGDELRKYADQLARKSKKSVDVSSRVELWRDMWRRELVYQAKKQQCGALKVCLARAAKQRRIPPAEIESRIGPEPARILRSGTLTLGTLDIQLNFSRARGIEPQVSFSPRLLAVEMPPAH